MYDIVKKFIVFSYSLQPFALFVALKILRSYFYKFFV